MDVEFVPIIERIEKTVEIARSKKILSHSRENEYVDSNRGRNVFISPPPGGLEKEYEELFTDEAVEFMVDLVLRFESEIEELYVRRLRRKSELRGSPQIPRFSKSTRTLDDDWRVAPVGDRLQNRHLDLGDVSPSDVGHFSAALRSPVQGIQVDFDDGHCPTWRNQILGLNNVSLVVRDLLPGVPKIAEAPVLMLRPRAWNMIEKNVTVNGRRVPGSIHDFSLLVFHNGRRILEKTGTGASFYLSKLEGSEEARLWNDIFAWSEDRLELPRGTVRACVLIENILSAFEMDDILWELREHSLGLNCGIWDYAASIISKFGTDDENFLLPDRKKYVNASRRFLRSYMRLVVKICHRRGAHATGGMAANLLPSGDDNSGDRRRVLRTVYDAKLAEVEMGLDGFMVYDLGLVKTMNELWIEHGGPSRNRIDAPSSDSDAEIREEDLLSLPKGGVTSAGLGHNIGVGMLFVFHWLNGRGHFPHDGFVEDSATAEISRSQVWQWIRHGAKLEDEDGRVTRDLVRIRAWKILHRLLRVYGTTADSRGKLHVALDMFLELVNRREFPEFITTYLNDEHMFDKIQSNL